MDDAIRAFRSERKKYLSLYPTVMDTLSILKSKECYIVAYTESKARYFNFRLARLGSDGVIDVFFSPENHEIPGGEKEQDKYNLMLTKQKYTPIDEIRPDPQLLLDIIKSVGVTLEECAYIDDNEMKDIEMAQRTNVSNVFASYGANHFEENKRECELLRVVAHQIDTDVERERGIKENVFGVEPTYIVK